MIWLDEELYASIRSSVQLLRNLPLPRINAGPGASSSLVLDAQVASDAAVKSVHGKAFRVDDTTNLLGSGLELDVLTLVFAVVLLLVAERLRLDSSRSPRR